MTQPTFTFARLPQAIALSRALCNYLEEYRKELGIPEASADECEKHARVLAGLPEKSAPKQSRPDRKKVSNVSNGRQEVLQGKRPKLIEAIKRVMGNRLMSPKAVVALLKDRKWGPSSKAPGPYVAFVMSDNPDIFTRVRHGVYRVKR